MHSCGLEPQDKSHIVTAQGDMLFNLIREQYQPLYCFKNVNAGPGDAALASLQ